MNQVKLTGELDPKTRGRIEGRVKFYIPEKGFGFVWDSENDRSNEIFMHFRDFEGGIKTLGQGDIVSFEIEQGKKGLQAVRIEFVRKATLDELQALKRANKEANANRVQRV